MEQYCPYCMEPLAAERPCPHCGKDPKEYTPSVHHLPPGTFFKGDTGSGVFWERAASVLPTWVWTRIWDVWWQ